MKKHIKGFIGKWLLACCLILSTEWIHAQQRYYCEIKGIEKSISGLKIIFDFGTDASYNIGSLNDKLKFVDDRGEEIKFNSMVDAANYMVERGWQFQQAYSSVYGEHSVIHWIFFKDAENMAKAKEGIVTKKEYMKFKKEQNN